MLVLHKDLETIKITSWKSQAFENKMKQNEGGALITYTWELCPSGDKMRGPYRCGLLSAMLTSKGFNQSAKKVEKRTYREVMCDCWSQGESRWNCCWRFGLTVRRKKKRELNKEAKLEDLSQYDREREREREREERERERRREPHKIVSFVRLLMSGIVPLKRLSEMYL